MKIFNINVLDIDEIFKLYLNCLNISNNERNTNFESNLKYKIYRSNYIPTWIEGGNKSFDKPNEYFKELNNYQLILVREECLKFLNENN